MSPAAWWALGIGLVAAAILGTGIPLLARAARLERLLAEHEAAEAQHRGEDMEGLVDATREPPPPSDGQADRLLRAVQDGEEL